MAAVNLPAALGSATYNADNEQTRFAGTSLSYDAAGQLTGDGTNSYTWDARHHLTQIAQGRTTTASSVYDAFGRRMKKTIGNTVTQFMYDGLNPVQELNGANPPSVTANLLTGLGIDEYFSRTDSSGTITFLRDALGSTIGLVNSAGGIATSYTYEPFGNTTVNGGNANPYQFTGRENDSTGMYYYRARYYSPMFQRFITQDPIDFSGSDINTYAYASDDPIDGHDPLGLYTDYNFTGGYGLGLTFGVQCDSCGCHPYAGGGLTTPGVSGSVTGSPGDVTPGAQWGLQGSFIFSGQVGSSASGGFAELGYGGPPGASLTGYYVTNWSFWKSSSSECSCH